MLLNDVRKALRLENINEKEWKRTKRNRPLV